ncbi:hypothetical protein ACFE04_005475 [Oxalis oulophora]
MEISRIKFDNAIPDFLKQLRLPGDAQRYCAENPGLFRNVNTTYVLAYAVIMLNTNAHNHHKNLYTLNGGLLSPPIFSAVIERERQVPAAFRLIFFSFDSKSQPWMFLRECLALTPLLALW